MKVLNTHTQLCLCCMEEHAVRRVMLPEQNMYKGIEVTYDAEHLYCDRAEELYSTEEMMSANDVAMKDAYRRAQGLLTSREIAQIRSRYGISQSDFCRLLGWGGKTITRYESHQVQDAAHDTILRKLDSDPEWFISLLEEQRKELPAASFEKYMSAALGMYASDRDLYLRRAVMSRYACYQSNPSLGGDVVLSLDKVIDVIRYFSDSNEVISLYKVKLMKLMWYADALSFKRRDRSITGLIYTAMPMGAVPIAHDSIINFSSIRREEVEIGDGIGCRFLPSEDRTYPALSEEDMDILNTVIKTFGKASKDEIVRRMHGETAYIETAPKDIIQFRYAKELSIS